MDQELKRSKYETGYTRHTNQIFKKFNPETNRHEWWLRSWSMGVMTEKIMDQDSDQIRPERKSLLWSLEGSLRDKVEIERKMRQCATCIGGMCDDCFDLQTKAARCGMNWQMRSPRWGSIE